MCIICVDFDKRRLTTREARRALGEMAEKLGERHVAEIEQKLAQAEEAEEAEEADAAAQAGSPDDSSP